MPACVIFDLDDTLIDTTGVLVPDTLRRVAEAVGVPVVALDPSGKSVDEVLAPCVERLAPGDREAAAAAWYSTDLPPLEPLPGAIDVLESLRGRVHLYLLTRGSPERQQRKVDVAGLRRYFERVVVRPIEGGGSKRDDIEAILAESGAVPATCAVVGDDETDELAHALDLGCLAIPVPRTPLPAIPDLLERTGLLGAGGGS